MDATNNDIAPEEVRNPIAALKRFARRPPPQERCELCALPLAPEHRHLVEPATRKLLCTCDACSLLFSGRTDGKYRQVPRRIEAWPNFHLEDYQWEALGIPIDLAFFYFSTPAEQVVAVYPSPAGATESLIVAEAWQTLIADNPKLASFEPDVEALLVNRVAGARAYYRTPIDECYKLVGIIKTHWRGLHGGKEVWEQIAAFFADLQRRAIKVNHA